MGFISNMAAGGGVLLTKRASSDDRSRRTWGRIFGTDKEEGNKTPAQQQPRGNLGSVASMKQLLTALRSVAPGGWSDNRFEQSNHFQGISYLAIHRTCEQMSQAEFQVLEKDERHPDGYRPVDANHPAVQLLEHPNDEDSFGDLMYMWNLQLDLTGMALTWMVPNQLGQPMQLFPIPTCIAVPAATLSAEYPDGYYRIQPIYPYGPFSSFPTPLSASGAIIPAQWMMRMKYQHPILRWDGFSPMTALRLHIDEVEAIDRSRWYAQRRAVNPSAVLNFDAVDGAQPLPTPEVERIHAEFENEQYGPENTGRLFVSTPGAKLEPWGATPKEMDYQQSWDQLVSFVHAGFGITKEAAGLLADSSYASLFATLKQFHMLTLEPKCNRIAQKLTRQLASMFGRNLVVRIRCQRIDDHEVRNAALNILIQGKAITKNELRRVVGKDMGLDMTKADWGTEIAGYEAPPEQPGAGMPGMPPGAPGAAPPPDGAPEQEGMPPPPPLAGVSGGEEEDQEAPEIAASRPDTGTLGAGALGPRGKRFNLLEMAEAIGTTPEEAQQCLRHSVKYLMNGTNGKAERNGWH